MNPKFQPVRRSTAKPRGPCRPCLGIALFLLSVIGIAFSMDAADTGPHGQFITGETYIAAVPKDFPPYYIGRPDGSVEGYAIDVMKAVAKRAGVKVHFHVYDTWEEANDALMNKEATLVPNIGITSQRSDYLEFTSPLDEFNISLFGLRKNELKFTDWIPKTTPIGTTTTNAAFGSLADKGFTNIVQYANVHSLFQALLREEVELLALPEPIVFQLASKSSSDRQVFAVGETLSTIKRAIGVVPGHSELLRKFDEAVVEYTGTKEFEETYYKWFGGHQSQWTIGELILIAAVLALGAILTMWAWFYLTERRRIKTRGDQIVERSPFLFRLRLHLMMLATALVLITGMTVSAGLYMHYTASLEQTREALFDALASQVTMIENFATFGPRHDGKANAFSRHLVIEKIRRIKSHRLGTAEYTIAQKEDGKIHFLLRQHHWSKSNPGHISLTSSYAEPMRLALSGKHGTVIGTDYRGETVLAAYSHIDALDIGVVLKVNMSDIRKPYIESGVRASILAFGLVLTVLFIFARLGRPIMHETQMNNQLFLGIADNAQPLMFVRDVKGEMIFANKSYCDLFGISQEDLLTHPEKQKFDPEVQKRFELQDREVIETRQPIDIEETVEVQGEQREYITKKFPLVDTDGNVIAIGAIAIEVTDLRITERALVSSEARFRSAFEQAAVGIILTDAEGHFISVNEKFCQLIGYSSKELSELTIPDIMLPDNMHNSDMFDEDGATHRQLSKTGERRYRRKDGGETWVRVSTSHLKGDNGDTPYFMNVVEDINEQVQAREEIAGQRDRFRRYLDIVGTLIVVLDRRLNIQMINRFGCEALGYSQDELIGRNWFETAIPKDQQEDVRNVALRLLDGQHESVEYIENDILTRTGERRLIAWNNTYLRNSKGEITSLLSSGTDITEARQFEYELTRTNRALRAISRCNEALVHSSNEEQLLNDICRNVVVETDLKLCWVSFLREQNHRRAFIPVTQFGSDQVVIDDIMLEVNAMNLFNTSEPTIFQDICEVPEFELCPKISEHGVRGLSIFPLHDHGDSFGALFIASEQENIFDKLETDLLRELSEDLSFGLLALRTERGRVRAELERRRIEERARKFIETAHDAIISVDANGCIVQFNPAAEDLFGLSAQSAIGMRIDETIIPERYREEHRKHFEAFIQSERDETYGKQFELIALRSDGEEIPIELTLSLMPEGTDEVCSAVIRDTRDRMEAERQRRQAQNMESLGNMAGGIAHDINNMLLPIISLTGMVQRDLPKGNPGVKKLEKIEQAAVRISEMVHNILTFSRQNDPSFEDQDIHDVIMAALELIEPTTLPTNTIVKTFDDFPGMVNVDATQITAALINLVKNASDSMEGNTGIIELKLQKSRLPSALLRANPDLLNIEYAKISIIDNGPGIPEDVKARVFDPFFTTKAPGEGTGLGLSMVHGIITEHHGTVDITSAPGQGTCVDLYIPLNQNKDEMEGEA